MNYTICNATSNDKQEILALYDSVRGGLALWDENYPSETTIDFDISRNSLFIMKNVNNEIIAAISLDDDEQVNILNCWNQALNPGGEISRVCVRKDMQNKGISRIMMNHAFNELKKRGFKSVRILVIPTHNIALNAYAPLGFEKVGECSLFNHHYYCFEKLL